MQHTEDTYTGGFLQQRVVYDDVAKTATTFNGSGVQTGQRALTEDEIARFAVEDAAATAVANGGSLTAKAITALTNNTTYLGIASPSNAQVAAQVAALTRQVDALIRLVANALDSTAGT